MWLKRRGQGCLPLLSETRLIRQSPATVCVTAAWADVQANWDEIPIAREVAVELEVLVELETLSEQVEEGEEGDLIGA